MRNEPTCLQDLTEKFSQVLLNDSLTLRLNDLQQSEFPAYWQAQPKFGTANFFMDDTVPVNLDRFYQIPVEEMISP
jgi:hypothetical protein